MLLPYAAQPFTIVNAALEFTLGISTGKSKMFRHIALIAAIAVVSFSSATLAQDGDRCQRRGACRADVQRLCAGVERGSGKIFECLNSQKDKLSDDCRNMLESRDK
jgi:hypothetical protein